MASRIFRLPHGWEGLPRLVLVFLLSLDDYAREVGKEVNNGFLFDSDYFTTGGVLQLAGYTPDSPPVRAMRTKSPPSSPFLRHPSS